MAEAKDNRPIILTRQIRFECARTMRSDCAQKVEATRV
jgi:hypothetical protein